MVGGAGVLVLLLAIGSSAALEEARDAKAFPVFSVVQFSNDVCESDNNRNGTCYTASECEDKDGKASGTCASGYGVCCVFELECGEDAAENNTYLQMGDMDSDITSCCYSICKISDDICRIRFDFTTFVIADPVVGTTGAGIANKVGAVGHCTTDQFSIASGSGGTPTICGTNTGQHMIVDAVEACTVATFMIGSTTTSRSWDIFVTQYQCGKEAMSMAGPEGCLQYFTGDTGVISSYNFPVGDVEADATHLANQHYTICIRREKDMCVNCYTPFISTDPSDVTDQATFGISSAVTAASADSRVNSDCSTDFLTILGGTDSTDNGAFQAVSATRYCGRALATISAQNVSDSSQRVTVCTSHTPFHIDVHFDGTEELTAGDETTNESQSAPGGIVGFKLMYTQGGCN